MQQKSKNIRLFIDVNETLIRTGALDFSTRLLELEELDNFITLIEELSRAVSNLELVFLTGNSFEYTRRIEEPLGLKNLNNVAIVIVSENGLIARSYTEGDLWCFETTDDYKALQSAVTQAIASEAELRNAVFSQGNEIRMTLKPVRNKFTQSELQVLDTLIKNYDSTARSYAHPYYFDVDPVEIVEFGNREPFLGKFLAVARLAALKEGSWSNFAIGDSASDLPMFEAVSALGGKSYWVSNASDFESFPNATILDGSFTAGVNEMLETVAASILT